MEGVRCNDSFVRAVKMTGCDGCVYHYYVFLQSLQYHNCQYDCQHRSSTPVMDWVVARLFSPLLQLPTYCLCLSLVSHITAGGAIGPWISIRKLLNISSFINSKKLFSKTVIYCCKQGCFWVDTWCIIFKIAWSSCWCWCV